MENIRYVCCVNERTFGRLEGKNSSSRIHLCKGEGKVEEAYVPSENLIVLCLFLFFSNFSN